MNIFVFIQCRDIKELKQDIYNMLTQPVAISVTDEDDVNSHTPNRSIDKMVENASIRESGELTDQLWDVLKGSTEYCKQKPKQRKHKQN